MPSRRSSAPRLCSPISPRYTHRVASLEPTSDCVRRNRRHLPLQGLSPRWSRATARHDPRAARVHPSLAAPCPATRLPPHPALRLARQFRPQGQYCACPRTACRGTAARACRRARTTRLAATLSLLWRAHDHHRDLRTMAATPRATSRARINREHHVVTRHGLRSPHAATPPLRRTPPGTPFSKISANVLDISRDQIPILASPGQKSHSPTSRRFQRPNGSAVIATKQNSKSPRTVAAAPRVRAWAVSTPAPCPDARSVMAGIRNLHHIRHSAEPDGVSEADQWATQTGLRALSHRCPSRRSRRDAMRPRTSGSSGLRVMCARCFHYIRLDSHRTRYSRNWLNGRLVTQPISRQATDQPAFGIHLLQVDHGPVRRVARR